MSKEELILKITKKMILWLALLLIMSICGTIVLKIFELLLNFEYENIWLSGFKVGLIAWIGMLINEYYHYIKSENNKK